MGFLDKVKGTVNQAKSKAVEAVDEHGSQIKEGIDKAGGFVNKKTKGKYADKIAKGTSKAGEIVDKANTTGDTPTPPPPPPPVSGSTAAADEADLGKASPPAGA